MDNNINIIKGKELKKKSTINKFEKSSINKPPILDKNFLQEIKKNKIHITLFNKKTNIIYNENSFLDDLNKSINNSININLISQKAQMFLN